MDAARVSILSQDYDALDLLLRDGKSTDKTVELLKSYGSKITFISQEDRGQSDAINQGFARADGDIVCWLNSDDLLTPHAIRAVSSAFEKNPDVDFVYGKGWLIDESGSRIGDAGVLHLDLWKLIHQRNMIQQPSCFFRKSRLAKVGLLNEALHYVMDWDLWIRFAALSKGRYLDEYLSCNRIYPDNKTQSGQLKRWREIHRMIRRYTTKRWPPVLSLYFLETMAQIVGKRPWLRQLEQLFRRGFFWGSWKRDEWSIRGWGRWADVLLLGGTTSGKEKAQTRVYPAEPTSSRTAQAAADYDSMALQQRAKRSVLSD